MGEATQTKQLSPAEAAKAVKRQVIKPVTDKEGNPVKDDQGNVKTRVELVDIKPSEVLASKVYDDGKIVVVTTDGKKFSNRDE